MVSHSDIAIRHSSTTELRELDVVPSLETKPAALSPVSPSINQDHSDVAMEAEGEVKEIEQLEARVEELEDQLKREEKSQDVPVVADVKQPTQAEVDRHNATHTPAKPWCRACNKGAAIRDKHKRKAERRHKGKRINCTEAPEAG